MKIFISTILMLSLLFLGSVVFGAPENSIASESQIELLKKDLRLKKLKVGASTLAEIRRIYGDAKSIQADQNKIKYDYGDLTIEFGKVKVFKKWEIISPALSLETKEVRQLKDKLTAGELIPGYTTLSDITAQYGTPVLISVEPNNEETFCYYSDLKITFAEVAIVKSWQAKKITDQENAGVLKSTPKSK